MNTTARQDEALLKLISLDDAGAFEELYDRYWKLLWQLAEKKTGDEGGAKDLVQELFIDIWNRRARLAVKGSLRTYLVAALYLKIFRYFRTKGFQSAHYRHFEDYLAQTGQHIEQVQILDHEEKELGSMADIIEATIEGMPRQMKKVFILKHLKHYSNDEIAGELGITVNTVKNHLKEGAARLRKASEISGCYPLIILFLMN